MSIASQLTTLAANKAAIKSAIEAKNPATAPTNALAQWPTAIASIPSGGGGSCALIIPKYPGDDDFKSANDIELIVDGVDYVDDRPAVVEKSTPFTVVLRDRDGYSAAVDILKADGTTASLTYDVPFTVDGVMMCSSISAECLLAGTLVTLADGREKPIEDIGYGDDLLVWDFERGVTASAKPLWIKRAERTDYMFDVRFRSGRTLAVTGPHGHRAFNIDKAMFEYLPRSVGDRVYTIDGEDEVTACAKLSGDFDYYNIITARHLNLFANGVLTSCRLNNHRGIDATSMKWSATAGFYHFRRDFAGVSDEWIEGLRLMNQPECLDELREYVERLAVNALPKNERRG